MQMYSIQEAERKTPKNKKSLRIIICFRSLYLIAMTDDDDEWNENMLDISKRNLLSASVIWLVRILPVQFFFSFVSFSSCYFSINIRGVLLTCGIILTGHALYIWFVLHFWFWFAFCFSTNATQSYSAIK